MQEDLATYPPSATPLGLTSGERLLLAGMRAWGQARLDGPAPERVVLPALTACASKSVASLFTALMQAVEATALRPIEIRCLHCKALSLDEQRLVVACGIAPVAFDLGREVLSGMLRDTETPLVLARALNGALASQGLFLPARLMDGAVTEQDRTMRTLH